VDGQKAVNFEEKYNIFLKTMFSEPPITDTINWNNYRKNNKWKWKIITDAEINGQFFPRQLKKRPGQTAFLLQ
jgi:hypothetical protein